jgi:hypothetical protein
MLPGPLSLPSSLSSQAPMSKMEPDQFINDRYAAMEDRLAVR